MKKKPAAIIDLHRMPEDERIDHVGQALSKHPHTAAIFLDDEREKIARYIQKLTERFPTIRYIDQTPGPVPGVVTVRFGPKPK